MKKILFFPLLFIAICLSAAPIGERRAREIAESLFSSVGTRSLSQNLKLEYAAIADGDERLYVFNRQEGGFAVIAGDDRFSPVIAFSNEHSFDSDNMPPAARHLLDCWAAQIADGKVPVSAVESLGNEVLKYQTPLWSQEEPYNREAPVINGRRCVTGCVATAMSMVLYYYRWPEQGVGTTPAYSYKYGGVSQTIPENVLGRKYDYNNMLFSYSSGYTSSQGDAIAALMKDLGTSVQMAYTPEASGASSSFIPIALSTYFKYSKAALCVSAETYDDRGWVEAMQKNLADCGPTIISGQSPDGGHAFIADGYTDRGYISFNFGWGGYSNGWYLLPSIEYNRNQEAIFGLVPDYYGTSTYEPCLSLVRLVDGNGQTVFGGLYSDSMVIEPGAVFILRVGGLINRGQTTFNGYWKLSICDADGKINKDLTGEAELNDLKPNYYIYTSYSIGLPQTFNNGDRIRLLYRTSESNKWKWARGEGADVADEIILAPSIEEIAEGLSLSYQSESKNLILGTAYTVNWSLTNSASEILYSGKISANSAKSIDVSSLSSGSYILSVSAGGRPYELILTF